MSCGMTLREAARRAEISPSTLSRWETGQCVPRVPELEALLRALGVEDVAITRILISLDAPRAAKAARGGAGLAAEVADELAPTGGSLIKALRRRARLSLSSVAHALGVAPSTVSRWESSGAHPSPILAGRLLDLLRASTEERICLGESGVAKIKTERRQFDVSACEALLAEFETTLGCDGAANSELRLLQIQSALWWAVDEPNARGLLRRAYVAYARFLVRCERYEEAIEQAERALHGSASISDAVSIEATRLIARADVASRYFTMR